MVTNAIRCDASCVLFNFNVAPLSSMKWKSRNPRPTHHSSPNKMVKKKVPDWLNSSLWSAPTSPPSSVAATEDSSPVVVSPSEPPQPPSPPPVVVQDPPPKQRIEDSRTYDDHDDASSSSVHDIPNQAQLLSEVVFPLSNDDVNFNSRWLSLAFCWTIDLVFVMVTFGFSCRGRWWIYGSCGGSRVKVCLMPLEYVLLCGRCDFLFQ